MGRTLAVKVRDRSAHEDSEYKNEVNIYDASMIATVLLDLKDMFNAPVEKACAIILDKRKSFPL